MRHDFGLMALTPPGLTDPAIAIAASRAGGIGVLDLQFVADEEAGLAAVRRLAQHGRGACGIRLDPSGTFWQRWLEPAWPEAIGWVLLGPDADSLPPCIRALRRRRVTILVEVISPEEARLAEELGVDGLIAKGHEGGGRVGDETAFILLQRLLGRKSLPVWVHGGIGLHSAAACLAGGAAGVVLDSQLALTRESSLPDAAKAAIARMDGGETVCLGADLGESFRVFSRPGLLAVDELTEVAGSLRQDPRPQPELLRHWRAQVRAHLSWQEDGRSLWPIGQEGAFAASLARRFGTVAGVLEGFRESIHAHVRAAKALRPLDEGAALARSHGTRYPVVQGPMTRVSDRAAFAARVAEGGGLPFLALALMRAPEVERLLQETRAALGHRPWGVGILGFVPAEVRQEQFEVIRACRPSFALIAGGRPDQALSLEQAGIPTYLHVPSPGLLKLFLDDGARRFIFEGRECGGHVGPRGSFALWDTMIETLLQSLPAAEMAACQVLFAGGIHDALSASMVAALGSSLAEQGARIGVLLGSAYLFTHEAVSTGAIVEGFQQEAIACTGTSLLESGPGHATRCATTPFAEVFAREKRKLVDARASPDEVRAQLEALNLGRLRVAAKGLKRESSPGPQAAAGTLVPLPEAEQRAQGMYMIGQVAALRQSIGTIEQLHREVSVGASERLAAVPEAAVSASSAGAQRPCDVAVIGMSCLLPKAPDLQTYWENILGKVDAITEVPADRWDWRDYYDPDPRTPDKVYSKWGGFLDEVRFDPTRYGMPPLSLSSIEPLQLLTLEAARAALQDAGYLDRPFPRPRTAVILGVGGGIADLGQQYAVRAALPRLLDDVPGDVLARLAVWSEDSFPGILSNVAAGRVANCFDLGGVNYTVDAACASSLAAVYLATRELAARASDMVIVGGSDTVQNPFAYLCFSKTHALSPRGRCRTFDDGADGIAISEGVAMLVLKRLADAERDGDRIYAVIKGVAGSSDGRDKSLTAPRPEGQALALERAFAEAGFSPATVGLIEAHGTGTVAGDQAEIDTLNRVFNLAGAARQGCAVGSVKSMIGHTKSTAGVAGLTKIALALHHKVLPPTLHVERPNSKARFSESPFYVNTEPRVWIHGTGDHPRRAGVSAFGFGGTNFHAVLEEYRGEYRESVARAPSQTWSSELLLWSAVSRPELLASLARLEAELARGARPRLRDLAFTTWTLARDRPGSKLALVATSLEDLREKLIWTGEALRKAGSAPWSDARGVYFSDPPLAPEGKVAFLFPGQGSQYCGMLGELALHFPEVREQFERADRVLAGRLARALSSYVFPIPAFTPEERQAGEQALRDTHVAQPALGAADLALCRLMEGFGVAPAMVAGHSYGEYVALCVAGAYGEETLLDLSEARGRCVLESGGGEAGTMASVAESRERVAPLLGSMDGVWIANVNGPQQTVISGTHRGVAAAVERLGREGIAARPLPVACGFHSPLMAPACDRFARVILSSIGPGGFQAPRLPVFSNASGAAYPSDPAAIASLLAEHLVRPVLFGDEIRAMYAAGARLFLEVGPRNVLTGLVGQILKGQPHLAVATDLAAGSGLLQLQHALGQLAAQGLTVDLGPLYAGRTVERLDLEALSSVGQDSPASATTWLVNGGRARPLLAGPERPAPAGRTGPALERSVPAVAPREPAGARASQEDGRAQVMLQFQQLMNRFLETQQQVTLAYLRGSGDGTPAPADSAASRPMDAPSLTEPRAAAAAVASDERERLWKTLQAIASERTGYPPEMLDPHLNIEADLGIDSIKRTEILGAFQRVCFPEGHPLSPAAMEHLTEARTLGGILEAALAIIRRPDEARPPVVPSPPADDGDVPRFLLKVVDAPLPEPTLRTGADDLFLVTDDGGGVADRLASLLRLQGAGVAVVGQGGDGAGLGDGKYRADLGSPQAVGELLRAVDEKHGRPITGLVHLLPLGCQGPLASATATNGRHRLELDLASLLHLTKAVAAGRKRSGNGAVSRIIAATALGGAFGSASGDPKRYTGHGAIGGFVKTLALEWPQVRCRVVDMDLDDDATRLAEQLVAELATADPRVEVGYHRSRRVALEPQAAPLDGDEGPSRPLDSSSVVLVTGGARGITAAVARELARCYRATLILVGRTPLATTGPSAGEIEREGSALLREREVSDNLRAMENAGATVRYHAVDVLDEDAFGRLIDEIYSVHGRIDGVIHGAGIVEDGMIENKTPESFGRVFDTKVRSALTLSRKLRPEALRFLAFFSSVAGRFGNRGQCDYAAANDGLNKLALSLDRRWTARVVSLNWGPWTGAGMASADVQRELSRRGMQLIESAAGSRAFDRELRLGRKGEVEVILGGGRWAQGAGI